MGWGYGGPSPRRDVVRRSAVTASDRACFAERAPTGRQEKRALEGHAEAGGQQRRQRVGAVPHDAPSGLGARRGWPWRAEIPPATVERSRVKPRSELESLPVKVQLLNLPEDLQLLVATHVAAPRDRAALCIAVPPLGRKAIKEIKAYKGPLMSLGNRVLSGGALSEAEVRRYVREFAPSEFEHWSLALNECAQLNAIAAPSARVRCVAHHPHPWWSNHLQWRLESGALLRSWEPFDGPRNDIRSRRVRNYVCGTTTGAPGIHHYEGAAGAERLVALAYADGYVHGFVGERGAELMIEPPPSYDGGDDFGDDLGDSAISYPDMAMISALISALSRA